MVVAKQSYPIRLTPINPSVGLMQDSDLVIVSKEISCINRYIVISIFPAFQWLDTKQGFSEYAIGCNSNITLPWLWQSIHTPLD